jgi:hypothetical protein
MCGRPPRKPVCCSLRTKYVLKTTIRHCKPTYHYLFVSHCQTTYQATCKHIYKAKRGSIIVVIIIVATIVELLRNYDHNPSHKYLYAYLSVYLPESLVECAWFSFAVKFTIAVCPFHVRPESVLQSHLQVSEAPAVLQHD